MTPGHDTAEPNAGMQRALLIAARCLLDGTPEAAEPAHGWAAAAAADCPGCAVIASLQLGFTLCASMAGQDFVTGELLDWLAAKVEATRAELDGAGN